MPLPPTSPLNTDDCAHQPPPLPLPPPTPPTHTTTTTTAHHPPQLTNVSTLCVRHVSVSLCLAISLHCGFHRYISLCLSPDLWNNQPLSLSPVCCPAPPPSARPPAPNPQPLRPPQDLVSKGQRSRCSTCWLLPPQRLTLTLTMTMPMKAVAIASSSWSPAIRTTMPP